MSLHTCILATYSVVEKCLLFSASQKIWRLVISCHARSEWVHSLYCDYVWFCTVEGLFVINLTALYMWFYFKFCH